MNQIQDFSFQTELLALKSTQITDVIGALTYFINKTSENTDFPQDLITTSMDLSFSNDKIIKENAQELLLLLLKKYPAKVYLFPNEDILSFAHELISMTFNQYTGKLIVAIFESSQQIREEMVNNLFFEPIFEFIKTIPVGDNQFYFHCILLEDILHLALKNEMKIIQEEFIIELMNDMFIKIDVITNRIVLKSVLKYICYSISIVSQDDCLINIFGNGSFDKLISIISYQDEDLTQLVLIIIENITAQTDKIYDCILPYDNTLLELLNNNFSNEVYQHYILAILQNLSFIISMQIKILESDVLLLIIQNYYDLGFDSRKRVIYLIMTLAQKTDECKQQFIVFFVTNNLLEILIEALELKNKTITKFVTQTTNALILYIQKNSQNEESQELLNSLSQEEFVDALEKVRIEMAETVESLSASDALDFIQQKF